MFLIQPCLVVLPLLPLVLPVAWLIINVYGVALILALFYTARHFKVNWFLELHNHGAQLNSFSLH